MTSPPANSGPEWDISRLLAAWSYSADRITARMLTAEDGRTLLQLRLDLGLFQMEVTGRPDGQRPHGRESLFDHFESKLAEFVRQHGTDRGFAISRDEARSLQDEASMYYHRYLAWFVLEGFEHVVSDTARNLRLMDFLLRYGSDEQDRMALEQHRPYVAMMNVRARAAILRAQGKRAEARAAVEDALSVIRDFFSKQGRDDAFEAANEVIVLQQLYEELKQPA